MVFRDFFYRNVNKFSWKCIKCIMVVYEFYYKYVIVLLLFEWIVGFI